MIMAMSNVKGIVTIQKNWAIRNQAPNRRRLNDYSVRKQIQVNRNREILIINIKNKIQSQLIRNYKKIIYYIYNLNNSNDIVK